MPCRTRVANACCRCGSRWRTWPPSPIAPRAGSSSQPFLAVLARTPLAFGALVAVGIALLSVRVIVTFVMLPVEFDASFRKALPILEEGKYLASSDMPAARRVLRAAAFTYVASALVTLVTLRAG